MASELWNAIMKRYPESQYAVMQEVSNAAGHSRSRSADFMVMGLWPSRGLMIETIEVKSNRSDWLLELKNPAKAETFFKYSDLFWLLTDKEGVAKMEEIPPAWGWLMLKGDRIIQQKAATKLTPIDLPKSLLAAMMKRAADKAGYVHKSEIQASIDDAFNRGCDYKERQVNKSRKEYEELCEKIVAFEKASGIKIDTRSWQTNQAEMGAAVKFIINGGTERIKRELKDLESTAKDIHDKINHGLATFIQEKINSEQPAG